MAHRVKINLLTSVWGEWHVNTFLRITIPSLLAPNNIPELVKKCNVVYRIYTTKIGKRVISNAQIFNILSKYVKIELILIPEGENPRNEVHMELMHENVRIAKSINAYLLIIHPDTVWNNDALKNILAILLEKKPKAFSILYFRVVYEGLAEKLIDIAANNISVLDIDSQSLQKLILKSLHPEQLVMIRGNPYSRPTLWSSAIVKDSGLVHTTFLREWVGLAPDAPGVTEILCNNEELDDRDYHLISDSSQVVVASLTPLRAYMADLRRDWPIDEIDVAATLNMQQHGQNFTFNKIRLFSILRKNNNKISQNDKRDLINYAKNCLNLKQLLNIVKLLKKQNYKRLAGLISYMIFEHKIHHNKLFSKKQIIIFNKITDEFNFSNFSNNPIKFIDEIKKYIIPINIKNNIIDLIKEQRKFSLFLDTLAGERKYIEFENGVVTIDSVEYDNYVVDRNLVFFQITK